MTEKPIRAVVTSPFDLGFILQHPNGRYGQLRVPEMSDSTAGWDRSPEGQAGVGSTIEVYVIRESNNEYLFSEFSTKERSQRDKKREDWISAQEQAKVGLSLVVRVEQKLSWGCICRQETEPFLEGVIATIDTAAKNKLPVQCATDAVEWEQLREGSVVPVEISYKQWSHWRHMLYFSLQSLPSTQD